MAGERRYSLKSNRLSKATLKNFICDKDGGLHREKNEKKACLVTQYIDGGSEGAEWGRLHFCVSSGENVVYKTYVLAMEHKEFYRKQELCDVQKFLSDDNVEMSVKQDFLDEAKAVCAINQSDILLYELSGRYLWIVMVLEGRGEFSAGEFVVDVVGDNFMYAFPEVYRERNSFFHRYMSVFSSLYNDFQERIDNSSELMNVNSAPPELLEIYAGWFGIDIHGGFLSVEKMRALMQEIYNLVKKKGSRYALERVAEIVLGEKPVIMERNMMDKINTKEEKEKLDELYSDSPYDVLLLTNVDLGESEKAQLQMFLEQFTPIRCRLKLIYLNDYDEMNRYTYLDINAVLRERKNGRMDEKLKLDHMVVLK